MDIPCIKDLISPEQIEAVIESVTEYLTYDLRGAAPEQETSPTLNEVLKNELEQMDEFDQYYEQIILIVKKTLGGIVNIEFDVTGPLTTSYGQWDCDIEGPWFVVDGKRLPNNFTDDDLREMIS